MKFYKLLFILLLPAIAVAANKEPKFMKGQKVLYKIPKFYSLVCSGKGKIERYNQYDGTYTVEDLYQNVDCPDLDSVQEKDIQAIQ